MTSRDFLDIIGAIERAITGPLGAFIASIVAGIIRRRTTITYTEEQGVSFVENELAALAHRADDARRAEG